MPEARLQRTREVYDWDPTAKIAAMHRRYEETAFGKRPRPFPMHLSDIVVRKLADDEGEIYHHSV